jgi:3-hexulose-6-phosphate synthase
MRLQLALDTLTLSDALAMTVLVGDAVDLVEAGTPLIKRYGIDAVTQLRAAAPGKLLVADMKTMDAGALEATMAFDAGADLMTVLACASDATIAAAIAVANERDKQIVADLIGVPDKLARARQLAALGVHMIGVHAGVDEQAHGAEPLADLAAVRAAVGTSIAVAGGISTRTIAAVRALGPEIVIVGSAITVAADPRAAALDLRALLTQA